jgi:hypothetical protein
MKTEIVEILKTGKSIRDLPRVVDALRGFESHELFGTLFALSVQEQGNGAPVALSAYALNEINPACPLEIRVAVESLLPPWDVSIEEVVFYLAKQFGARAAAATAVELGEKYNAGTPATLLRAISYWANASSAGPRFDSEDAP